MSSTLELRHLETLLALAECGSLSKTASRLFLTQSALSHQLKALENHYGAGLVERNTRPLRFTAIGQRLVGLARSVLPLVAEAGRDVARLAQGHAGPLRVAVQCQSILSDTSPGSSDMCLKTLAAPTFRSLGPCSSGCGWVPVKPRTWQPAQCAAVTPVTESSTTMQSSGA